MHLLTRDQFAQLSGTDLEALKTLRRRDQVPAVPVPAMGDAYTPFSAFLMGIANEFANEQGIARSVAAEHASRGFVIDQRWADVAASSEDLRCGRKVASEIFFAVIELPGAKKPRVVAVCGTLAEIVTAHPNPLRMALANVTRAAAKMRKRAAQHNIDVGKFWGAA